MYYIINGFIHFQGNTSNPVHLYTSEGAMYTHTHTHTPHNLLRSITTTHNQVIIPTCYYRQEVNTEFETQFPQLFSPAPALVSASVSAPVSAAAGTGSKVPPSTSPLLT